MASIGLCGGFGVLILSLLCAADSGFPLEPTAVPPITVEPPYDGFTIAVSDEDAAALAEHDFRVGGRPADGSTVSLWGWARAEWTMPTPQAGPYVVTLHMISGDERPGRFGYRSGRREYLSEEFREKGRWSGCMRAFRIQVPAAQHQTEMFLTGNGVYLSRVAISRVTGPPENAEGRISRLAPSSYRTVLKRARGANGPAPAVVLLPPGGAEREAGRELAARLGLPTRDEPELGDPFPAFPPVVDATPDTNLILLSAGHGGPLVQALRRATWIEENHAAPGPGGYVVRTIPRPFRGRANVILIASSDAAGLARGISAFAPRVDESTGETVYDTFLTGQPGERWEKLRSYRYRLGSDDDWWDEQLSALAKPYGGLRGGTPGRSYIRRTSDWGDWYWRTGNDRFAELFKLAIFKMEDDDIYGGSRGADSHMQLYGLMRAWDRVEESPVFSDEDRLRITNYLLLHCVEGNEGFARAYAGYSAYSGDVGMRHNHQTILGCGLMQASLYYDRLYGLGRAAEWKAYCDDLIARGTLWGHAPEDSANYEVLTFLEVADMLHYQGLSTAGPECTAAWPDAALRFAAIRDSFSLPAAYGDCWSTYDWSHMRFFEIMAEDWGWPAAQFLIDRHIAGYRRVHPDSTPARQAYAYTHGSTAVGGLCERPDEAAAAEALKPLLGLVALPMTEGFYTYMSGGISNREFWREHGRPDTPPYEKTADKIQYRSGWEPEDEYLLLEALGWADHGHFDLGTLVQYCHGGRLWIVDAGYNNVEAHHHSTLEVARDGQPAWGYYPGQKGRWGDFRAGPQMFQVLALDPPMPGTPGPFSVTCRATGMAGATWTRTVSGGEGRGLVIEDVLAADEAGEYEVTFRLRLLGVLTGSGGEWTVSQKDATLPVRLDVAPADHVRVRRWEPDSHTSDGGAYGWYAFNMDDGKPKTLEWARKANLRPGASCTFRATLGPSRLGSPSP